MTNLRAWTETVLSNPLYAALLAGAAMFVPFVEWLGWGWVALVTLRYGVPYSFWVILGASLGILAMVGGLGGLWSVALIHIFLFVIPIWIFSLLLRASVSLTLTLQCMVVSLLIALVWVDAFQLMTPENIAQFLSSKYGQMMPTDTQTQESLNLFAEQFAASWPSAFFFIYVTGVFLGRWWQAALDNPGGFAREFYALRLNFWLGSIGFIYILMSFWLPMSLMLMAATGLVVSLFVVAGLGFVHYWVAYKKWSGWALVAIYAGFLILTIIFLPLLVVLAAMDSVIDLRTKLVSNE